MTYSEKLKDPRWQKKRLEILNRDKFTCLNCGATDKTLHVHHVIYKKDFEPWEYDQSLITLCEECHEGREKVQSDLLICSSRLTNNEMFTLAQILGRTWGAKVKEDPK